MDRFTWEFFVWFIININIKRQPIGINLDMHKILLHPMGYGLWGIYYAWKIFYLLYTRLIHTSSPSSSSLVRVWTILPTEILSWIEFTTKVKGFYAMDTLLMEWNRISNNQRRETINFCCETMSLFGRRSHMVWKVVQSQNHHSLTIRWWITFDNFFVLTKTKSKTKNKATDQRNFICSVFRFFIFFSLRFVSLITICCSSFTYFGNTRAYIE